MREATPSKRPYGGRPSVLSPPPPMGKGASNRSSMTEVNHPVARFGEGAEKATASARTGAGPASGKSLEDGRRTHEHGFPESADHDAHVGGMGDTHLRGAVEHLDHMRGMRPDTAPNGAHIKR